MCRLRGRASCQELRSLPLRAGLRRCSGVLDISEDVAPQPPHSHAGRASAAAGNAVSSSSGSGSSSSGGLELAELALQVETASGVGGRLAPSRRGAGFTWTLTSGGGTRGGGGGGPGVRVQSGTRETPLEALALWLHNHSAILDQPSRVLAASLAGIGAPVAQSEVGGAEGGALPPPAAPAAAAAAVGAEGGAVPPPAAPAPAAAAGGAEGGAVPPPAAPAAAAAAAAAAEASGARAAGRGAAPEEAMPAAVGWRHNLAFFDAYSAAAIARGTPPTLRHVPTTLIPAWKDLVGEVLEAILAARAAAAAEDLDRLVKLLLALPRLALAAPPEPATSTGRQRPTAAEHAAAAAQRRLRWTAERFRATLAGEFAGLWQQSQPSAPRMPQDAAAEQATRAVRAAMNGSLQRAVQALTTPGVAPACPAVLASMREQLERGAAPAPQPERWEALRANTAELNKRELVAMLRRASRGGGKDAYGWAYEHVQVLLGDARRMEKLHAVLNAYLRAELGATAAEASRVAPTTPLRKRGGGVRCVAVGFLLRRLGLGALLRQRRAELRAAVGPWQFAVGRPAAIETLVRELRHEVSRRTAPAVILFDCKNAFGEVPRRLIADQVIARVPELAAPIMMGIAGPTLGLVRLPGGGHAELESNHGVPQGSAEGPVAFALAMTAVVDDFRRELEAAIGAERAARVCLFAYLDDVTLVAEEEDAEAAIMAWRSALARAELRESQGKTVVWTASGRPPPGAAASAAWAAAGRHDGFVLLGTAVAASAPTPAAAASGGVADAVAAVMAAHECDLPVPFGDDAFIQEFLATRLQHAAALASAVGELPVLAESGLPAMQAATALLRQCFMQRHAHLARTVPPELFRPFAQQLEDLALRAFEAALALPRLDGWRRAAVFEPLADGGVGLQPLADLTTAAFIGGRAAATAGEEEQREVRRGQDGGAR